MPRPTFYPTALVDNVRPQAPATPAPAARPKTKTHRAITVLVTMPHVKKFGKRPTMRLVYGCSFMVRVGDVVLCPPTRLNPKWTRGTVASLKDNGYRGPIKFVAALGTKQK